MKKSQKDNQQIKVSTSEKELLREIVRNEKSSMMVFQQPDSQERRRYERILQRLDGKLA